MQKSLHRQSKGYSGCLAATYRSLQAAILHCFICVAQIKNTMSTCAESPVLKGVPPGPHAINLSDTASVYHQVCSQCCCCPKRTSIHAPVYVLEFFFAAIRHVSLLHEQSKLISLCDWLPAMCAEEAGQTDRLHEHK